ncbi:MAG: SDR family oxidoreductase [Deltaproteobacteria bacterium]|nr:SDR family oxidoreductase [Deltaproteobacteria bacterium]MBW2383015.1 SDR family oxidoreductase [Deltaproteobacteria bacterium]MBW2695470.1 SDR family oxidoreductase [Deltaproteobacteria bacterium]
MDLGLKDRTVIVTGASGGIGRGLVLGFAAEGARVVLASRDEAKCKEVAAAAADLPGETLVVATDITNADSVRELAEVTHRSFGELDVLVNNAGGVAYPRAFLDKPDDEIEWELALNVHGVLHTCRQLGRAMVERGEGSIVNITSNSALLAEAGNMVANYAGTKGYVMAFSKALAYEWGPRGVRVNCVSPGWIVPWEKGHVGSGSFWEKYGWEFFGTPDEMARQAEAGDLFNASHQPIKRIGRPEDIAAMTLFLCSPLAAHITGQLVSVSGGAYMP